MSASRLARTSPSVLGALTLWVAAPPAALADGASVPALATTTLHVPPDLPLGLTFSTGAQFPVEYANDAFVGLHGSWNRSTGTGFKVQRIAAPEGAPLAVEDFIAGWQTGPRGPQDAWGRPVNVKVAADGALLISDDVAGAIYRVVWTG